MTEPATALQNPGIKFRPEIQGLRAIAVLMVMLFHFQLLGAKGGFAGVDVFFVISGFLITNILIRRSEQPGRQLIVEFLIKRLWRIAPAYLVVVLLALVIGWIAFLPLDYTKIAESAISCLVFISNHYFMNQAGYFEDAANLKPLAHTWSLAVEMQFYLTWPLIYLLIRKFSFKLQGIILLATVLATFGLANEFNNAEPEFAFYSFPTRLWQFGAGALLVNPWTLTLIHKLPVRHLAVQIFALGSLLTSTFLLDDQLSWPAPWALIPTLATMVLIAGGHEAKGKYNHTNRFLSHPLLMWFGKISYSLYLVHWPIVCLVQSLWWPNPSPKIRIIAMMVSVALGWALFRFVEDKFRRVSSPPRNRRFKKIALITMPSVVAILSVGIWSTSGIPQRFNVEDRSIFMDQTALHAPLPTAPNCLAIVDGCAVNNKPTIFLWGDSHARQYRDGIALIAKQAGYQFSAQFQDGCPPAPQLGIRRNHGYVNESCAKSNQNAVRNISRIANLDNVILIARWAYYTTSYGYNTREKERLFAISEHHNALTQQSSAAAIDTALTAFVSKMAKQGTTVTFIMQIPEFKVDPPRCLKYAIYRQTPNTSCQIPRAEVELRQKIYRNILGSIAERYSNVQLVEPASKFCGSEYCSPVLDGQIAYRDDDHLLNAAAYKLLLSLPSFLDNQVRPN